MKISLKWLSRYVDIAVPVPELCEKMVKSGFEVESVEDLSETMKNVVLARLVKLEKHPDSDHLQICQMDVGSGEPVQIVTGADNVFEGALVPAALHDSYLPDGTHIRRGKLRGVESNGMLCSGEELGLKEGDYPGAEVNGILIMQEDCPVGTDLRDILGLNDTVIDFKITANRPDCQSVLGVAREIAVALGTAYRAPSAAFSVRGGDTTIGDCIKVTVEDHDLCPRYYGRAVNNLRIAPSPAWMKECLKAAGMRPINNIVDITNFVMLETGQPMHAFDRRDIAGGQIVVRRAAEGEEIVTLDGKPHTLTGEMLVIADAEKPSCLAGIMGGENSEIKPDTTELFLESAKFRRDSVRRTARALGMRTESSARFEHGVDIVGVEFAMNRALHLIEELDAGDIVDGFIDCNEGLPQERTVTVTADSVNALLGLDIPAETMQDILNRLQMPTTLADGTLTCRIPSFREDVEGRADIAEEVIRIYGCDHIVATPLRGEITRGKLLPDRIAGNRIKAALCGAGLHESMTYSFINGPKACDLLRLAEDDPRRLHVTLLNPLSEEYGYMRTQLVSSMLTVLSANIHKKAADAARLFELSKRFAVRSLPLTEQPDELPVLCIGLYGDDESFFTLKGLVGQVLGLFTDQVTYVRAAEPYLHPGRSAAAMLDDQPVAIFGEVHPDVTEELDVSRRLYVAEIELAPLYALPQQPVRFRPLPRYPAVERDLALVCRAEMPVAEIEETIRKAGGKLLERAELFDVYQGAQIEKHKKSVAYSLYFRKADGTLSDDEINPLIEKMCRKLEEKGCVLRS